MMVPSFYLLFAMFIMAVHSLPVGKNVLKSTLLKITGQFGGHGTFFRPKEEGGDTGACGPKESNESKIVALNLHQYGNANKVSDWCFKKVLIRSGGKSTVATITDACPGCQEKSLDLTPSVFEKLAPFEKGIIDIDWCVIGTDGCSDDNDDDGASGKSKSSSSKSKGGKKNKN